MRRNPDPDAFLASLKDQVDPVEEFQSEKNDWQ
jgi:hypothetical protein